MGIAKRLNNMGEPNPEAYKKKKGLKYNNPNSSKNDGLWSASTVARILQNEIYTGVMVQGRHRIISYKVHKQIAVPEDEYRRLKGRIAEQTAQLEQNISYLKEEMQVMADGIDTDDPYLTAFLKHKNIQTLNRGIVVELVNMVWVHENGEITVDFNFADEYQRILDYIENNHNILTVIEQKPAI